MTNQSILFCLSLFLVTACSTNENTTTSAEAAAEAATTEIQPTVKDQEVIKESTAPVADTEKVIVEIRKEFGRIEALLSDDQVLKKELSYSCPDDPQDGGFVFYFKGDTLLKANHNFVMGDHYGQESSYYFQNGALVFGFHQSSVWNFDGQDDQGNATTKDDVNVQRDYFYQGEMVKQLFKDYTISSGKQDKQESEVPNLATGNGVESTLAGSIILNISTKEKLTCEKWDE